MFLPPKMQTILCLSAVMLLSASDSLAQSGSQFETRSRAIRAARARAQQQREQPQPTPASVAPASVQQASQASELLYEATARATGSNVQQVQYAQSPRSTFSRRRMPRHLRTAQLSEAPMTSVPGNASVQDRMEVLDMQSVVSEPMVQSSVVHADTVIGESYLEADGCLDCGDGGCGRGILGECSTCPPMGPGDCWLSNFGRAFRTGEYFAGATAFRGPGFTANGQAIDDGNFGFYGGINLGIPLCRLSCGLLSGQLGIRSTQSVFDGSTFSPDNRDQLFVTAGLYRRVDYGWQIGVVADILHEEWFAETDLVQIRTDVAWAYGNGTLLGFRSASATQDDITLGIINGNRFANFQTSVVDQYRFYYRRMCDIGGYSEIGLGWTEDHFIAALDLNLQISDCVGMQSGFTYFLGDDDLAPAVAAPDNDAWNLYVGLVWRPQGRGWWKSYDRPMFDVVDNGSMLMKRQ